MNRIFFKILYELRILYIKVFVHPQEPIVFKNVDANILIKNLIKSHQPCMIARFGSTEATCISNYLDVKTFWARRYLGYIITKNDFINWDKTVTENMCFYSGFFPNSIKLLENFSELMLEDMNQVDILGSWLTEERKFQYRLHACQKIPLADLEPYYHSHPWSEALQGKKVLVIHPYQESIIRQYKKRELLFSDARVLPQFELKTIKAIQSIANNYTNMGFQSWFDALEHMKKQIDETDFDIAIIGCGAYGFPLAAHVKRIGKQAIHLGGATQILFGIKGKRWENHEIISKLMNEHWVYPLESEKPLDYSKIEGGCYWG